MQVYFVSFPLTDLFYHCSVHSVRSGRVLHHCIERIFSLALYAYLPGSFNSNLIPWWLRAKDELRVILSVMYVLQCQSTLWLSCETFMKSLISLWADSPGFVETTAHAHKLLIYARSIIISRDVILYHLHTCDIFKIPILKKGYSSD